MGDAVKLKGFEVQSVFLSPLVTQVNDLQLAVVQQRGLEIPAGSRHQEVNGKDMASLVIVETDMMGGFLGLGQHSAELL